MIVNEKEYIQLIANDIEVGQRIYCGYTKPPVPKKKQCKIGQKISISVDNKIIGFYKVEFSSNVLVGGIICEIGDGN